MISNKNMYVQFIDDERGLTLAAVSTAAGNNRTNIATAKLIGQSAAEAALSKGIKKAVVDRGGYKFHGRLKAIVDALNAAGVLTGAKEAK
jgi:large subunit ribosomal protein L18